MLSVQSMDIKDLLTAERVFELRPQDKPHVLKELSNRAAPFVDADPHAILQAIAKREKLGSTGLGNGVAVPHARLGGVKAPFGLFALLRPPIQFDAIDDRPVDLVFFLLLPEAAPEGHMPSLACVARRLRDATLADQLRRTRGAAPLFALLTDAAADGSAAVGQAKKAPA